MKKFLYKADSKELWLVMPEPPYDYPRGDAAVWEHDEVLKAKAAIRDYNYRLHYTVSPELHELLKDRKDEIKENEFAVVDDYDPVFDGLTDYGGPPVKWGKIAIPLPEQTNNTDI